MGWETIIYMIIAAVISIALAPKPPKPKAATIDDFDFPTAEEGRPIPVVFGTVRVTGPNVLWYGDLGTEAIKKKSLFSSATVGYKYFMGIHFGICHGPVDAVTRIEVGDKLAWSGSVTANSTITINRGDLFGGKKKEGGLKGYLDVCFGGDTQGINAYLDAAIGRGILGFPPNPANDIPAFRGILGFVWRGDGAKSWLSALFERRGGYIGTTAYPKPWAFTVRRINQGWHGGTVWYSAKSTVGIGMNAVHVLYETLTNPEWGMGLPTSALDDANWRAAADQAHAEGFGLCLQWVRESSVEDFARSVLDHVTGMLAFNRTTGKWQLILVRGDYDPGTLTTYGPDKILEVRSYQRQAWGETINELTLSYTDPTSYKETSVTVHDLGNIASQGVRLTDRVELPGITDAVLAQKAAARELAARSTPLAKVTFSVDRSAWTSKQGDVVKLTWPTLGVSEMVVRIFAVRLGTLTDNTVEIDALEDIFGMPSNVYTSQPDADAGDEDQEGDEPPAVGGPSVISTTTTAPPATPADGDAYLVPAGATGAWAGHVGEVAIWDDDDGWQFELPTEGTVITETSTGGQVQVTAGGTVTPYTPIQTTGKVVFGTMITPPAITANENDYTPTGLLTASGMRLTATGATRTLTGLAAGSHGQMMLVHNIGTQDITLADEDAASVAANRFALNANITLKRDQSTLLQYDGTSSRWRVIGGTGSGAGGATEYNDGASVSRSTDLACGASAYVNISFTTEDRDDNGYWDAGAPDRFTIPQAGWYVVGVNVQWNSTSTGRGVFMYKNALTAADELASQFTTAAGTNLRNAATYVGYFAAGDQIIFRGYSVAASSIAGTTSPMRAYIHRIGIAGPQGIPGPAWEDDGSFVRRLVDDTVLGNLDFQHNAPRIKFTELDATDQNDEWDFFVNDEVFQQRVVAYDTPPAPEAYIVNGDASSLTGWTVTAGAMLVQTGYTPPPGWTGAHFMSDDTGVSVMYQRITLADWPTTVDLGLVDLSAVEFNLDWWCGTFSQGTNDTVRLTVRFRNAALAEISNQTTGDLDAVALGGTNTGSKYWILRDDQWAIPPLTRYIDVEFRFDRNAGTNNDGGVTDVRASFVNNLPSVGVVYEVTRDRANPIRFDVQTEELTHNGVPVSLAGHTHGSHFIRGAAWSSATEILVDDAAVVSVVCPAAGTIVAATMLGDTTGSAVVNVRKTTFAGFPTATSICASTKPTLAAAAKSRDTALTGWTTSVAAGDILTFTLEACSGLKLLTVQLELSEVIN